MKLVRQTKEDYSFIDMPIGTTFWMDNEIYMKVDIRRAIGLTGPYTADFVGIEENEAFQIAEVELHVVE